MVFHLLTIFPKAFERYWQMGVIGRAARRGLISLAAHDLRDFSLDKKHRKVDSRPYGGGPGMVLEAEPIIRAVEKIRKNPKSKVQSSKRRIKVIILSAEGKPFTNALARRWAKHYDELILIAGRYEGIDARVKQILKAEEISIGPYVLAGGELPAAVIIEAVARQLPGVLGHAESVEERRPEAGGQVYARPEVIERGGKRYRVPKVLLSGHHAQIAAWRRKKKLVNKQSN